ncbi:MAG: hypothetical protein ABR548_05445 [Actinomycetota bacterium]|nr:hypothetical protein [Actinomycetota bacterium]
MRARLLTATLVGLLLSSLGTGPARADTPPPSPESKPAAEPVSVPPSQPDFGPLTLEGIALSVGGRTVEAAPADKETKMVVTIKNSGDKVVNNATMKLEVPPDYVRVIDGSATLGDLAPGEAAKAAFTFVIPKASCYADQGFGATITSSLGDEPLKFSVPASCPGPRLYFENAEYTGGDGDNVPEPGEVLSLVVTLRNSGRDAATDVTATIKIDNAHVSVTDGTASWPDIKAGDAAKNVTPFVVKIDSDAPRSDSCGGVIGEPVAVDVAADQPVSSDGAKRESSSAPPVDESSPDSGGSSGSTGNGTASGGTTTGTIEPDQTVIVEPAPTDTPEPTGPSPDAPAAFDVTLSVSASGERFDAGFGSGTVCALREGGANLAKGAPAQGAPANATDSKVAARNEPSSKSSPVAVASVLLVALVALLLRFRFLGAFSQLTRPKA